MNSDLKICYRNIYVIQICKKQNKSWSHYRDSSWHTQPILPNLADFFACVPPALQNAWFYHLVLSIPGMVSCHINLISRQKSWLLIFRSWSFKNRRELCTYSNSLHKVFLHSVDFDIVCLYFPDKSTLCKELKRRKVHRTFAQCLAIVIFPWPQFWSFF